MNGVWGSSKPAKQGKGREDTACAPDAKPTHPCVCASLLLAPLRRNVHANRHLPNCPAVLMCVHMRVAFFDILAMAHLSILLHIHRLDTSLNVRALRHHPHSRRPLPHPARPAADVHTTASMDINAASSTRQDACSDHDYFSATLPPRCRCPLAQPGFPLLLSVPPAATDSPCQRCPYWHRPQVAP